MKTFQLKYIILLFIITYSLNVLGQKDNYDINTPTKKDLLLPRPKLNTPTTSKIKELFIGDAIPNMELNNILNSTNRHLQISDFKGKAFLIDFWATWCAPCVASFPKLDSIQKEFQNSLQIIYVTNQDSETVSHLFKNLREIKKISPPSTLINDTIFSKLFKHRIIPHYIWINSDGIITAITGKDEVTYANIQKLVSSKNLNLPLKKDKINYNIKKSMYADKQYEIGDELLYQSVIAKFRQDLPDNGSYSGTNFIDLPNHSIVRLYQLAFGKFSFEFLNNNRIILEGINNIEDSIKVGMYTAKTKSLWKSNRAQNTFTYEFFSSDSSWTRDEMFEIMQQDINRYFSKMGISGRIEKRVVKTTALIRTSEDDKIISKGGAEKDVISSFSIDIKNLPISHLISKFQASVVREGALPIRDKTAYKKNVDISINADLKDLDKVNAELEKYDLKFVEQEEKIDMLIISKKSN